ncbi:uncharacterized protein LTR77_004823 [Saxophila tyrrhenica]|uniref:ASST-domain-containing protein n=1 Tax=Saxophila tyrrhenica TaxID=1690608 RepID=A0AAV9PDC1_9PEZI|nr:hypothetical protein LTR77_004823 [Saxophila tyrrhenica]
MLTRILPCFCVCLVVFCSNYALADPHTGNPSGQTRSKEDKRWEHRVVHLDESKHEEEFWTFVTRPDLDAPRWEVAVYDQEAVAPGYWFVAPYEEVDQKDGSEAWNAPHIYDQDGQLIWSGAPMFDGFSSFDFRVSEVRGKPMLTLLRPHYSYAAVLDETYTNIANVSIGLKDPELDEVGHNMHEFLTVENGTRALYLTRVPKHASKEYSAAIGYDGECHAQYDGFVELDTETWEQTFSWNSYGKIGLDESFVTKVPVDNRCSGGEWDFLHLNSIDKFPDGDYLVSGRRTNAVYKISAQDGSIIWRLGGRKSDFEMPFVFSGQHAAKIQGYNDTHTLISFLDNAFGPGTPQTTNDASRGLLLALDTKAMTVEVLQEFKHPDHKYAEGQGNLQFIPGTDHAWICWRDRAMHTEHAGDGSMIMEARFKAGVRNYRSFKLPWVGRPAQPPDVRSTAVQTIDNKITTIVSMSWNGATEVHSWKIFAANPSGTDLHLLKKVPRDGFETTAFIDGYVGYIVVKAMDASMSKIGEAAVFATVPTLQQLHEAQPASSWIGALLAHPIVAFIVGAIVSASACIGAYVALAHKKRTGLALPRNWKRRNTAFESLSEEDKDSSELDSFKKRSEFSPERSALLNGEGGDRGRGEED